jgi:hypothetical protein
MDMLIKIVNKRSILQLPILTDKILNNKNFNEEIWENAITKVNTPESRITDPKLLVSTIRCYILPLLVMKA